jgi:hypothetical protein
MRILEWQASLISRTFTPHRITLLGVIFIDISLCYVPYYFWSGEKFGVYSMSFLALFFAGIICVVEGVRAEKEDADSKPARGKRRSSDSR